MGFLEGWLKISLSIVLDVASKEIAEWSDKYNGTKTQYLFAVSNLFNSHFVITASMLHTVHAQTLWFCFWH